MKKIVCLLINPLEFISHRHIKFCGGACTPQLPDVSRHYRVVVKSFALMFDPRLVQMLEPTPTVLHKVSIFHHTICTLYTVVGVGLGWGTIKLLRFNLDGLKFT